MCFAYVWIYTYNHSATLDRHVHGGIEAGSSLEPRPDDRQPRRANRFGFEARLHGSRSLYGNVHTT